MTKQTPSFAAERSSSALGQAWSYHAQGKDEQAIVEFNKLLGQKPDDVDILYGLGLAQRGAGQKEAALETFRRVSDLLSHADTGTEDAANRVTIMSRMVHQQITVLEEGQA